MKKQSTPKDIDLFLFTDSVEEAINHIAKYAIEGFRLKKKESKDIQFVRERVTRLEDLKKLYFSLLNE